MPTLPELVGLLVVVAFLWIIFKVLRFTIRLLLFLTAVAIIAGAVWWFFSR